MSSCCLVAVCLSLLCAFAFVLSGGEWVDLRHGRSCKHVQVYICVVKFCVDVFSGMVLPVIISIGAYNIRLLPNTSFAEVYSFIL